MLALKSVGKGAVEAVENNHLGGGDARILQSCEDSPFQTPGWGS